MEARDIVKAALGRDPGPMVRAPSLSHRVHVGADVVVKTADRHARLDREIALVPHLPAGITAPLLASGRLDGVRFACYARMPGAAPGRHLPNVDAATARALAEQAVDRLRTLHAWTPGPEAAATLSEPLDHGGFTGRAALHAEIERLRAADKDGVLPGWLVKGLAEIADRAPDHAGTAVPVHADCFWDNWLADGDTVTALLDFEWARLGEPLDDWFFLIRFSGRHAAAVLDVVARATSTPPDELRAGCELREAAHLAFDVRLTLEDDPQAGVGTIEDLEELLVGRYWWRSSSA